MLVTEVRKITDRRKKILLEDGTSFVLYNSEVRQFGIHENEELPDEMIRRIMEEILKKRACLRCMNLLKTQDRTVQQLRQRLLNDGYPDEIITRALEYVASYHYTDDMRFARNYFRQMSGRKSRRQIEFELLKKGVDRETVRAALCEAEEESGSGTNKEKEAILAIARKRNYDPETAGSKEAARLLRYLLNKGFAYESIREAIHFSD